MRLERHQGTDERKILIGMVVDTHVLGHISERWNPPGLFSSRWSNLIGGWCVRFYQKYKKAPNRQIEDIFRNWARKSSEENTIDLIEQFLDGLSDEYEETRREINSDYLIDLASLYFNRVKIQNTIESLQTLLDSGEVEQAIELVNEYHPLEIGIGAGIDVLQDEAAIQSAFQEKSEPLMSYPGALGDFFSGTLERDSFIAFMGPEKRGKSFWLQDVAFRAILQRRKVAFFEVGDMSQNQVMRRFMVRASHHPIGPCTIRYPKNISVHEGTAKLRTKTKKFKQGLSWIQAKKSCQILQRKRIRSQQSYFRLSVHPNSSLSVQGLEGILLKWEMDEWVPDVIIIDYADILNMSYPNMDMRHRINETWKELRALSQKWHCLLVTATQTDAASYSADLLSMKHFSEDKRKLSHITGMIGLNATPEEKDLGVMRLNWVARREGHFSERRCVYVAGCLALANPAIKSCFDEGIPHGNS